MGGSNPYIPPTKTQPPKKSYKIKFLNIDKTIEVDPSKPGHGTGLPFSVLDMALANGVEIDHACGGVCACSTCHIYVKKGLKSCPEGEEAELDMLDLAPDLKPYSRLACQCVPTGSEDLEVEIPSWNRNLAREGK